MNKKEFNEFKEKIHKDAPISILSYLNFSEISNYVKITKELDEEMLKHVFNKRHVNPRI